MKKLKMKTKKEVGQYLQSQLQRLVSLKVGFQIDLEKIKELSNFINSSELSSFENMHKMIKKQGIKFVGNSGTLSPWNLAIYIYYLDRESAELRKDYFPFDYENESDVGLYFDSTNPKVDRALKNADIHREADSIVLQTHYLLVHVKEPYTISDVERAIEQAIQQIKRSRMAQKHSFLTELRKPKSKAFIEKHGREIMKYEAEKLGLLDTRKWLEKKGL